MSESGYAAIEGIARETAPLDMGYCSQLQIAGFELVAQVLNDIHGEATYSVTRHELDGNKSRLPHQRTFVATSVRTAGGQQDLSEFWRAVRGLDDRTLLLRSVMAIAETMKPDFGQ